MGRRTLFSLIVVAAALALVGAGTFAVFTDTETSVGNTFTAGSLDLKVKDVDGTWVDSPVGSLNRSAAIDALIGNLKPGASGTITVPVKNDGSLDGNATLKLYNLVEAAGVPGAGVEPGLFNGAADLAGVISVTVAYDGTPVAGGQDTLADLIGDVLAGGVLPGDSSTHYWTIDLAIAAGVDNIIMGDTATVDVDFGLTQ